MPAAVRFTTEAEADLRALRDYVSAQGDPVTADAFVEEIITYCESFATFPKRGRLRNDIRPGLRIVGFRRRVSVAFIAGDKEVVILSILYAGRDPTRELRADAP